LLNSCANYGSLVGRDQKPAQRLRERLGVAAAQILEHIGKPMLRPSPKRRSPNPKVNPCGRALSNGLKNEGITIEVPEGTPIKGAEDGAF
jgi:hypothetical protein